MAVFKEIKERINSIGTTRKITSAMKMVSAAKLGKAQRSIADMRPYSAALYDILGNVIMERENSSSTFTTTLTSAREVRSVALVAFSSDGSLAGAFNSNVVKELRRTTDKYATLGMKNIHVYAIGKKVREAAAKLECSVTNAGPFTAAKPDYDVAAELAMLLVDKFVGGEIDKVEVIYHHYKSAGSQVLTHEDFLPMPPTTAPDSAPTDYIFEPSRGEILAALLPRSLKLRMYSVWLDTAASEHAARVIAMQTATENADKLIAELTVQYNKLRQQSITNELLDIMGGSLR